MSLVIIVRPWKMELHTDIGNDIIFFLQEYNFHDAISLFHDIMLFFRAVDFR